MGLRGPRLCDAGRGRHRVGGDRPPSAGVGPRQPSRARDPLCPRPRRGRHRRGHRALVLLSADRAVPLGRAGSRDAVRPRERAARAGGLPRARHGDDLPGGARARRRSRRRDGRGDLRERPVRGVQHGAGPAGLAAGLDRRARRLAHAAHGAFHAPRLVARGGRDRRARPADQAAVSRLPGAGGALGARGRAGTRSRAERAARDARRPRAEHHVVRASTHGAAGPDREPVVQAGRGIRPPGSVVVGSAFHLSGHAPDVLRRRRDGLAGGGARRRRAPPRVARARFGAAAVRGLSHDPEQERALHAADPADGLHRGGARARWAAPALACHRHGRDAGGRRHPGQRHRLCAGRPR